MKKVRFFMPLLALLFAVVGAFGFQPKPQDNLDVYMWVPGAPPCPRQENCGASFGDTCDAPAVADDCSTPITAYKF